ncbi:hypothetical protein KTH93_11505 [Acinetobacter bereziniae]|uniref:hypothetical protein n=1 Tax=Acinetobacter bereziniae TaxID=106648 RepID=UPI0021D3CDD9|nr:hypothetical protein [Acinetobacter bereziniae]MCU4436094.1 hypothetical protein [Acinetobacter bereziniae]
MSSYRDDYLDIAYISDQTWMKTQSFAESFFNITSDVKHIIRVFHSDELIINDSIRDHSFIGSFDELIIQDSIVDKNKALYRFNDDLMISDSIKSQLIRIDLIEDRFTIDSEILEKNKSLIVDHLIILDQIQSRKFSYQYISENSILKELFNGRLRARLFNNDALEIYSNVKEKIVSKTIDYLSISNEWATKKIHRDLLDDQLKITSNQFKKVTDNFEDLISFNEIYSDRLIAKDALNDQLNISDEFTSPKPTYSHSESISVISSEIYDHLIAKQWIFDTAFIEDEVQKNNAVGGAWTANADNWAMSRYEGYNFTEICVIDGKLYGVAEQGVYVLDANTHIQAKIKTGKLDLGNGNLVHPVGAYLEYELSGISKNIQIGVKTTQSGNEQVFFYKLPQEQSNHLTNGRVLFGRVLRGRHFSFEIKVNGDHGYINDINIDIAATKRRV